MGPTWVLLAPDGPNVGPMNLALWVVVNLSMTDFQGHSRVSLSALFPVSPHIFCLSLDPVSPTSCKPHSRWLGRELVPPVRLLSLLQTPVNDHLGKKHQVTARNLADKLQNSMRWYRHWWFNLNVFLQIDVISSLLKWWAWHTLALHPIVILDYN